VFDDEQYDNNSAYDSSTGVFTAPSDGIYSFTTKLHVGGTNADQDIIALNMYKNSSTTVDSMNFVFSSTATATIQSGTELSLLAGDTINFKIWNDSGSRGKIYGTGGGGYEAISYIYGKKIA